MAEEKTFDFLNKNERASKPRTTGVTEIRGPYYTVIGKRHLSDLMELVGDHVDSLKFSGGAFSLMPRESVIDLLDIAHEYDALVSTGGFMEYVLTQGDDAVDQYIETCKDYGFDIIELSAGFITLPTDDWLRLIEKVQEAGLKAKPEIGIQFGAGGDTTQGDLESEGTLDTGYAIKQTKKFIEAGAYMIQIESEGITENANPWRTDVPAQFINEIGLEKLMFEAADPDVFAWYIKNYGPEVNVFVDHSQIIQLETLRRGIWGTKSLWGRVLTYKG
jgi:phosphosulfolactate synthase (CoM biosynthesis protein A)